MSVTGFRDGPPTRLGVSLGDIAGGMFLSIGILAALTQRALNNGMGQMVDLSLLDCQVALLENAFVRYFATGEIPARVGNRHPVSAIHQVFATKDGHMAVVASGGVEMWARFLEIIGRIDLLPVEKYQNKLSRAKHVDELEPIISVEMAKRTTAEWMKDFNEAGIPCGPVNTIDQAAADPQLNHREMFIDLPCPQIPDGKMRVSNSPLHFSETPVNIETGAPEFGQNTAEVLASILKMSKEKIDELEAKGIISPKRLYV
jgi:CoA:oxalate CoA-transferase